MAVVALVASGDEGIRAVPGRVADVARVVGSDYAACGCDCHGDALPPAMRLPTELVQQLLGLLPPRDFNAARHSCRAWFVASLDGRLLADMLRRGGWWSSMRRILSPVALVRVPGLALSHDALMSRWLSRECRLADPTRSAFADVGRCDFGAMAASRAGAVAFTASLCGAYVVATQGQLAFVYELNHACAGGRARAEWSLPLRRRQGLPPGVLRPVSTIICPRTIMSCSMDTSAGRYAVAFLMDGRVGMVCDVAGHGAPSPRASSEHSASPSAPGPPSSFPPAPRPCVCHERGPYRPPRVEAGQRSVYRNICHADDPPRSVAICPQRNCVAFGCGAGIELHWVDAITGQDLSRWFPLSSPSDFLYFLPARRGVDTARKLRLISSAAGLGDRVDPISDIVHGFSTTLLGSGSSAMVSLVAAGRGEPPGRHGQPAAPSSRPGRAADVGFPDRKVAAGSADHFRAVPLSDGCHILFTDPRTGNLCLGTDAPVGSLTRLLRKVWFRPPADAVSPVPVLYAAGADMRHGVRVVAAFAAGGASPATRDPRQMVVFYTVPPDVFHDMSRGATVLEPLADPGRRLSASWQLDESYHAMDMFSEPLQNSAAYPVGISGQTVAMCSNLSELALDASPEMIIWAFSSVGGWARTWAVDTGSFAPYMRTAVQRDGSVRRVDTDGDVGMVDAADDDDDAEAHDEEALSDDEEQGSVHLQRYDGAAGSSPMEAAPLLGCYFARRGDKMSGTVSVDLVEEVSGIVRLDVELR